MVDAAAVRRLALDPAHIPIAAADIVPGLARAIFTARRANAGIRFVDPVHAMPIEARPRVVTGEPGSGAVEDNHVPLPPDGFRDEFPHAAAHARAAVTPSLNF